jgi:hypothetical protein
MFTCLHSIASTLQLVLSFEDSSCKVCVVYLFSSAEIWGCPCVEEKNTFVFRRHSSLVGFLEEGDWSMDMYFYCGVFLKSIPIVQSELRTRSKGLYD